MKVVFSSNTAWYLYNFRKGTIKRFIEKEYEVVIMRLLINIPIY